MNSPQMTPRTLTVPLPSELLQYLARLGAAPGSRLPPIHELAQELGVSTGKLREQLEVARELGLVEVRPKTGIRFAGYDFFKSIRTGLRFALALDPAHFDRIGLLRNHIEASFWFEAAERLRPEDKQLLQDLMARAWEKLQGDPVQIPHVEHKALHLTIYSRLENTFVLGLLEAYWEAYETVGLNLYADYDYLREVWTYHGRMVEAILSGDLQAGYQALVEHTDLLQRRPQGLPVAPVAMYSNGPTRHGRAEESEPR
jgi:DNA-binding FadR family transcriptional regulator